MQAIPSPCRGGYDQRAQVRQLRQGFRAVLGDSVCEDFRIDVRMVRTNVVRVAAAAGRSLRRPVVVSTYLQNVNGSRGMRRRIIVRLVLGPVADSADRTASTGDMEARSTPTRQGHIVCRGAIYVP